VRSDTIDLAGQKFGRWYVIGSPLCESGKTKWLVKCECGTEKYVFGGALRKGVSQSCGCLHKELLSKPRKTIEGIEHKHCYICKEWKELKAFNKSKHTTDGLGAGCAECRRIKLQSYRQLNPDKCGEWARNNPGQARANSKRYRAENPDWWKKWNKKYYGQVHMKIRGRVSAMMRHSLKNNKNGKTWENMVGYNLDALKRHLEKILPDGYTMDDLSGLHIDHIIPVSVFNITDEHSLDFKRCWDLSNLRFLPALENIRKSDKLFAPFQPSLAIGA
jgi:hypothetical protein